MLLRQTYSGGEKAPYEKNSGSTGITIVKNNGIGIFDSGVGGLTVLKEIKRLLPHENIFYLGDTARVPYGNKSRDTIIKYSIQNTRFLIEKGIKLLVVACNTSSSLAINALRHEFHKLPIIGVIEPGSQQAVAVTKTKRIGVIGTRATIASNAYGTAIRRLDNGMDVFQQACPLFVPIVEEGMHETAFAHDIASYYLKNIKKHGIDTLILGCTHYPALSDVIQKAVGKDVRLINSGQAVAIKVYEYLSKFNLLKTRDNSSGPNPAWAPRPFTKRERGRIIIHTQSKGSIKFFVTDAPSQFKKIGRLLLSRNIDNNIYKAVLEDYD